MATTRLFIVSFMLFSPFLFGAKKPRLVSLDKTGPGDIMKTEGRCCKAVSLHKSTHFSMLTARATGQSARFYGQYVGHKGQTHTEPQKLLSSVSHIRITSLRREVANRRYATAPCSLYRRAPHFVNFRRPQGRLLFLSSAFAVDNCFCPVRRLSPQGLPRPGPAGAMQTGGRAAAGSRAPAPGGRPPAPSARPAVCRCPTRMP